MKLTRKQRERKLNEAYKLYFNLIEAHQDDVDAYEYKEDDNYLDVQECLIQFPFDLVSDYMQMCALTQQGVVSSWLLAQVTANYWLVYSTVSMWYDIVQLGEWNINTEEQEECTILWRDITND